VSASVEGVLGEATRLEKEYEWLQASELYEQALDMIDGEDHFRRGEIQEKIGHSLHRAAFQAESREEFLESLGKAVEAYDATRGLYEKLADERGAGWALRCGAIARYIDHWIATDPSEKRRLLDECLDLERDALEAFWDGGDKLEYCRTYGELPELFWHISEREYTWKTEPTHEIFIRRQQIIEEGIRWGERAVEALSELGDPYVAVRVHLALGICYGYQGLYLVEETEEQEKCRLRATEHFRKATEISEEVEDDYLIGQSHIWLGQASPEKDRMRHLEKALKYAEKPRDIYLLGLGLSWLVHASWWVRVIPEEDPDKRRAAAEEIIAIYDEAMRHLSIMSFYGHGGGVIRPPGGYCEHFLALANWETDPERKLELLDRSLETGRNALKIAEDSGTQVGSVIHALSKALTARARLESEINKKKSLLGRAIEYRERYITMHEQLMPYHYWDMGIGYDYLADIKAELAHTEANLDIKRSILEEAISDMEKGLQYFYKVMPYYERRGKTHYFASLYHREMRYAALLTRLYELTNEQGYLGKAIEVSHKAIESARKVDWVSRIAESYWEIAKAQAIIGEHEEAAENFDCASENYRKATEKIPQLKKFYQEYASYMMAWGEFERAKQSHEEKRYMQAKEHYEKAAELYRSTERWSYLAPNYLAWARLDEAEDLSRSEETEKARDLFKQAVELFSETEDSIKSKLNTIEVGEERQVAEELIKASDVRREYSLGRVALEEARIHDRQGDHLNSSKRYGQAVERFQGVLDAFELELDRRELRPIVYLCRAWQKMMLAEAQMSPSLYDEAANLFNEARDNASDQTTRLLSQAHSSFCKALEAGTRFEKNRDTTIFSLAKNHIEAATSYYLRAGYRSSSDYATATNRLLDGYMYSYNAQTEIDPDRKARFYQMAERLLQDSAGLFLKAKHPGKSDEVRTILENIRGEKEIALSLAQLMHAPTIMQITSSFSTPTPTHEQAVGLERFENADIQANFIARRREVGVGDDLDLEIELVNAGKAPAKLVKVEDIVIEGFELKSYPEICRVEDSYLDMKGRTLSPLKTQELKLVLKPLAKGAFELKPRILYLDESGKYKSHEPEPVSITVQELGIRGWLRGPTR
jgi:tetratricopeptide (TPR) repeat protein